MCDVERLSNVPDWVQGRHLVVDLRVLSTVFLVSICDDRSECHGVDSDTRWAVVDRGRSGQSFNGGFRCGIWQCSSHRALCLM